MRGRNVEDTEFVKAGSYHTLEIEPNRAFEIGKQTWDALDIERVQQACDPAASADLAIMLVTVSMQHSCSLFRPILVASTDKQNTALGSTQRVMQAHR